MTTISLQDEKVTLVEIIQSLEPVLNDLKLETKVNESLRNSLSKVLRGKLRGKWNELKDGDHLATRVIITTIQNELFDMILDKEKAFKLYEMR